MKKKYLFLTAIVLLWSGFYAYDKYTSIPKNPSIIEKYKQMPTTYGTFGDYTQQYEEIKPEFDIQKEMKENLWQSLHLLEEKMFSITILIINGPSVDRTNPQFSNRSDPRQFRIIMGKSVLKTFLKESIFPNKDKLISFLRNHCPKTSSKELETFCYINY